MIFSAKVRILTYFYGPGYFLVEQIVDSFDFVKKKTIYKRVQ